MDVDALERNVAVVAEALVRFLYDLPSLPEPTTTTTSAAGDDENGDDMKEEGNHHAGETLGDEACRSPFLDREVVVSRRRRRRRRRRRGENVPVVCASGQP